MTRITGHNSKQAKFAAQGCSNAGQEISRKLRQSANVMRHVKTDQQNIKHDKTNGAFKNKL